MATRTLSHISRILAQPARPLSTFRPPGGGYGHNIQFLIQPVTCRTFYISRIPSASISSQASQPVDPSKNAKTEDGATTDSEDHGNMDIMVDNRLKEIKSGDYKKMAHPENLKHFSDTRIPIFVKACMKESKKPPIVPVQDVKDPTMVDRTPDNEPGPAQGKYTLPHPIWSEAEVYDIKVTHKKPKGIIDNLAMYSVKVLRGSYDIISGYNRNTRDEALWINRIIFLETVAGVPGMVAAMIRHLHSLRKMRRDHGWIHTLLEEAENERMHLMTAMQLKQPSLMFRCTVMGAQGVFVSMFSLAYLFSPRYCHRFVGYLEEEAVITYTKCLKDIDNGDLRHWNTQPAPVIARRYWNLLPASTMRDVILAIRADEAHHRVVNHTLASMNPDDFNPYKPGE